MAPDVHTVKDVHDLRAKRLHRSRASKHGVRSGGVKVLEPLSGARKLPEEAHSSGSYILLDRHGVFHQYREYDRNHYLRFEIGYHPEPKIDPSGKPVLHVHEYKPDGFRHRTTRPITQAELEKYKHLLKGVPLQ